MARQEDKSRKRKAVSSYTVVHQQNNDIRKVIKMYKRLVYLYKRKYRDMDDVSRQGLLSPHAHAYSEAMKCASAHGPAVEAALQRYIKGERP